ncbi:hypothetical protein FA15DRAFT_736174 [Coprinopsis marcescibilis]|uniref:Uncharacterized protein n=1 Tax=Coprinopsis marcescibilis TaxID=230819 RepID=A0A5C3KAX7_COPMA|nr:hypothetical protein FA15DRAFT_736174 [Coprinopsis marcescibilis]
MADITQNENHIHHNPHNIVEPNWALQHWQELLAVQIALGNTLEQVTDHFREAWRQEHQGDLDVWDAQMADDKRVMREHTLQQQEEEEKNLEERQRFEQEREEVEARAQEEKKPKLKPIVANRAVSTTPLPQPSQYTTNKVESFEYIKLYYFTLEGHAEALVSDRAVSNAPMITRVDNQMIFAPMATMRASKKMSIGKGGLITQMQIAKQPAEHIQSLGAFFLKLEGSKLRHMGPIGDIALLTYQAEVQQKWHNALRPLSNKAAFDISIINQERVDGILRRLMLQHQADSIG